MARLPDSAYSKPSYSGGSIIGLHQVESGVFCEKVVLVPFGILQVFHSVTLSTTGIVVSTNIQTVTGWSLANKDKNTVFVKIYDQITIPTIADIPIITIGVGPTNTAELALPFGLDFKVGLALRASLNPAFNDATPVIANTLSVNLFYTQ